VRGLRSISRHLDRIRSLPRRALGRVRGCVAAASDRARLAVAVLRHALRSCVAAAGPFAVLALGACLPVAVATWDTRGGDVPVRTAASARLPASGSELSVVSAPPVSPVARSVPLSAAEAEDRPDAESAPPVASAPPPSVPQSQPESAPRPPAPANIADQPPANLADGAGPPDLPAGPTASAGPATPAPAGAAPAFPLRAELPSLDCVIEPDLVVALGSPVPGVIQRLAVERGDVVEEGQVLVELEAGPEKAAVALAQARAALTSEIRASEASLGLGERQAARNEQLLANRAVSVTTKDEAVTEAILARLRLDQARENRRLAELELGRAQAALDQRTLRSPVRGVVMERLMAPGELVSDQPVLRLGRIDPLKVEVIAPADLYGSVRRGMRAEISPEMPGRGSFTAEVRVVDPVIDAASGTFGVSLELPNPEHGIPGGLRCKVRFVPE
jgi:RND family efflux transporter MFP subunit